MIRRICALLLAFGLLTGTAHADPSGYFQDGFENDPGARWRGDEIDDAYYGFENANLGYQGSWNALLGARAGGIAVTWITADVSTWTKRGSCRTSVVVNPLGWADTVVTVDAIDVDTGQSITAYTGQFSGNTYQYLGTGYFSLPPHLRKVRLQVAYYARAHTDWRYARVDWMRLECPTD